MTRPFLNLSYEGGSSANTYFMLRYLLANDVRPRLLIFNINSKESNSLDSAYRRLHPALERLVYRMLNSGDRIRLSLLPQPAWVDRLDAAVSGVWTLYRLRTDLREALFGADDAAAALKGWSQNLTGSAALQAAEHTPTPDRFIGTYDLSPLANDNTDFIYLQKIASLIRRQRIATIAFLTPTNHALLHQYIDSPEYDKRLLQIAAVFRPSTRLEFLNLDRAMPPSDFFDNDHLTPSGNAKLAGILVSAATKLLAK